METYDPAQPERIRARPWWRHPAVQALAAAALILFLLICVLLLLR